MSLILLNTANVSPPSIVSGPTILTGKGYQRATLSGGKPAPQPPPPMSSLGSVNGGKLAGPPKGVYGTAIPKKMTQGGGWG